MNWTAFGRIGARVGAIALVLAAGVVTLRGGQQQGSGLPHGISKGLRSTTTWSIGSCKARIGETGNQHPGQCQAQ